MTLSTIEAEYVALADTIKEAIFLRYGWRFILPGLGSACITVLRTALQATTMRAARTQRAHVFHCFEVSL